MGKERRVVESGVDYSVAIYFILCKINIKQGKLLGKGDTVMIRKIEITEIEDLYKQHILPDFNLESPPKDELEKMAKCNCVEVLSYEKDQKEIGYAVCLKKDSYMMLLFFAVYNEARGNGVGSQFIMELREFYKGIEIFGEVESIDNTDDLEEQNTINRRIAFYENLGFCIVPGIKERLNGFNYHIMTLPPMKEAVPDKEEMIKRIQWVYEEVLKGFVKEFKMEDVLSNE